MSSEKVAVEISNLLMKLVLTGVRGELVVCARIVAARDE